MAEYTVKELSIYKNGNTYKIQSGSGDAVYTDVDISIPVSAWSVASPYTYTYTNNSITVNAGIEIFFRNGIRDGLTDDLIWEKTTRGIIFTTNELPVGPVLLTVRIIDSQVNEVYNLNATGKPIKFDLGTVTNTSGSYSHTFTVVDATSTMKAINLEVTNPAAFLSKVTVTVSNGEITLACDNVVGTSDVAVTCVEVAQSSGSTSITSEEFETLSVKIGDLASLTTTDKTSAVDAINELNSNIVKNDFNSTSGTGCIVTKSGKIVTVQFNENVVTNGGWKTVREGLPKPVGAVQMSLRVNNGFTFYDGWVLVSSTDGNLQTTAFNGSTYMSSVTVTYKFILSYVTND